MPEQTIAIKPHHFVDIIASFGDGERTFHPHPYGHAVHIISERILCDHNVILQIELGADDICRPCTHNISGYCDDIIDISNRPAAPSSKGEWNLLIDTRWCERIKVKQGDRFSARELAERIQIYMGDIRDIYREIPEHMTNKRAQRLLKGIRFFLKPENNNESLK
jgi:hypothetical protein